MNSIQWSPRKIAMLWKVSGATSRRDFSRLVGVSDRTMYRWLKGYSYPTNIAQNRLIDIARQLDCVDTIVNS